MATGASPMPGPVALSFQKEKKKAPVLFIFAKLGLIILFLPQMEVHKKTKAHIIHTWGQDQVLLLSGSSWRLGEEMCFPAKTILPCDPGSVQGSDPEVNEDWSSLVLPPRSSGPWRHAPTLQSLLLLCNGRNRSDDHHQCCNPHLPTLVLRSGSC